LPTYNEPPISCQENHLTTQISNREKKQKSPPSNDDFLTQVGNRVRGLRANRGMSRKMLSTHSEVSERYLADLEQGKGNISINLLRQVAMALNTNIDDLLPSGKTRTPEQVLINEFISRLEREDQQSALQLLYKNFSDQATDTHTRIALIGLRGAGKTTLGQLLNERAGLPFIRLSNEIEKIAAMPVAEIMSLSGQAGYRRLEEKALFKTLQNNESCCIETGGSIVSEIKGLNLLLTTCLVVWVKTSPEEHMNRVIQQGDLRPLEDHADAMDDLRAILTERTPFYEQAHITMDTSGKTVEESYKELTELIQQNQNINLSQ
jgi:XRE family aerobic/anaerobic benzoate catabolism transcriptional regulator